jgi:hypothetical protein
MEATWRDKRCVTQLSTLCTANWKRRHLVCGVYTPLGNFVWTWVYGMEKNEKQNGKIMIGMKKKQKTRDYASLVFHTLNILCKMVTLGGSFVLSFPRRRESTHSK